MSSTAVLAALWLLLRRDGVDGLNGPRRDDVRRGLELLCVPLRRFHILTYLLSTLNGKFLFSQQLFLQRLTPHAAHEAISEGLFEELAKFTRDAQPGRSATKSPPVAGLAGKIGNALPLPTAWDL